MDCCEICRVWDEGADMLECDKCLLGYHMRCLQPALESVPEGDYTVCGYVVNALTAGWWGELQESGCAPPACQHQSPSQMTPAAW